MPNISPNKTPIQTSETRRTSEPNAQNSELEAVLHPSGQRIEQMYAEAMEHRRRIVPRSSDASHDSQTSQDEPVNRENEIRSEGHTSMAPHRMNQNRREDR